MRRAAVRGKFDGRGLPRCGDSGARSVALDRRPEVVDDMPSLIRFLIGVVVFVALGAVGLYALANFVDPRPREMTIRVPQERLDPR